MSRILTSCLLAALAVQLLPGQSAGTGRRTDRVSIPSEAVGGKVQAAVHLPAGYDDQTDRRFPVIIFLHGAGRGSESTWERRGTEEVVSRLVAEGRLPPCIVVCPRARRFSFWINWKGGEDQRHGDFVTEELPAWVDARYRILEGRAFRALMGDSMGGFGALVNALRNPDVFGSVSAHEPSIYAEDIESLPHWIRSGRRGRPSLLERVFGDPLDQEHWLSHNIFRIVKRAKPETFESLPIYFDVGTRDRYGLAEPCRAWHRLLEKKGIEHTFHLREGGHGSGFFVANVPHSLAFHGQIFQEALDRRGR